VNQNEKNGDKDGRFPNKPQNFPNPKPQNAVSKLNGIEWVFLFVPFPPTLMIFTFFLSSTSFSHSLLMTFLFFRNGFLRLPF
jgi:hypothetical protein